MGPGLYWPPTHGPECTSSTLTARFRCLSQVHFGPTWRCLGTKCSRRWTMYKRVQSVDWCAKYAPCPLVFFDGDGRKLSCYSKEALTCARILAWRENQSAPSFLLGSVQGVIYEKCYLHDNGGLGKYLARFNCLWRRRCDSCALEGKWEPGREEGGSRVGNA
ncbi:hypothetical protein ElyMa_004693900 [Elysia marginata]|uniref:Uncharacterized protein n=1 Tax=Elysia marginata TaxID=1093978 RepID=A0AAV4IA54_9GAST|nr:hypothetical protein ElyMa_004693900 [Elysia marginata]